MVKLETGNTKNENICTLNMRGKLASNRGVCGYPRQTFSISSWEHQHKKLP